MKDADREADVIERQVQWANSQPLVRALLLESSRASDRAPIDILSDYDVILAVSDMRPFSHDETWLQDFGKILVLFRDQGQMHGLKRYNRLVLKEIMVGHFLHLTPTASTPDAWEQEAEGRHLFRFYWIPLAPRPELIEGQDTWLERVYDALLCSTGIGCQSTRASK